MQSQIKNNQKNKLDCEVLIIGAGPNGISIANEACKIFGINNILVLEKGSKPFNNLRNMPNVRWHSEMRELTINSSFDQFIEEYYIPTTSELISFYELSMLNSNLDIRLNVEVTKIEYVNDHCVCSVNSLDGLQDKFTSRFLIICTGIYENPRKLKVNPNQKIHYNSKMRSTKQNFALIGAGNSATDFIINMLPYNNVTWFIRNEQNNIRPNLIEEYNKVTNQHSKSLKICKGYSELNIYDMKIQTNKGAIYGPFDKIEALIGFNSISKFLINSGLKYEEECLKLNENFQTSISNVYAFGSIMTSWNKDLGKPEQTFIHNGNKEKSKVILNDIVKKLLIEKKIPFNSRFFISSPKKKITLERKIKNIIKKILFYPIKFYK